MFASPNSFKTRIPNFNAHLMKILIKTLCLMVALTATSGLVAAEEPASRLRTANAKTIQDYFRIPGLFLPSHAFDQQETLQVQVLYTTDRNGRVDFVLARTGDRALKRAIEERFIKLTLLPAGSGVVRMVVLEFRNI